MDNVNNILENDNDDKHAMPSTDVRVFEIGDTPTICSRNSTSSTELVVSEKPDDDIIAVLDQTTTMRKSDAARAGFDPARIPASVFGSKASTPMEWSFASNESLFSIHVANTSLSKDQFLFRSGELTKFDHELARFSGVVSNDQINYGSEVADQSYAEAMMASSDASRERDRFDWSYNTTAQSFQFPVLVGGHDSGMMSSPKMEPRRHRAMEKWHNNPTPPSSTQIIQSRENSHRFETKQSEHNSPNWLLCLTCCFKPCR